TRGQAPSAVRRSSARCRRTRRRSRSDRPPQMPNFSPCASAYSRQSTRTSQLRHTAFASRVDAPRSGKKRSGSTPKQLASSCQLRPSPSVLLLSCRSRSLWSRSVCCIDGLLPYGPFVGALSRSCNYTDVILHYHKWFAQGGISKDVV